MAESYPNGQKTLWEKEKLLITSNFSFFRSVFKRLVLQTCKNQGLFGKGLTLSQTNPHVYVSEVQVLKTIGKRELLITRIYPFPTKLYALLENFPPF